MKELFFPSSLWHKYVPEPEARTPITLRTFHNTLMPVIPLLLMAYLVRRPNTHLMRVFMLPPTAWLIIRASYSFVWVSTLKVYDFGGALFGLSALAKAMEYAFISKGRLKLGEKAPGELHIPAIGVNGIKANRTSPGIVPQGLSDALEVICSVRGLGWDFGQTTKIPKEFRPLKLDAFLRATARSFVISFLCLDFLESCIKIVLHSPNGGSIFLPTLSPLPRYTLSTTLHLMTGLAFISGFNMVYYLLTFLAVRFLNHSPTSWPPIFDSPWLADSLHDYWANRWHQLLRQTFLTFGGYPAEYVAYRVFGKATARVALVLGTFTASGLFHNWSLYAMGGGTESAVTWFFILQGFGVVGERLWRIFTGKRVGGWIGRTWAYFMVIGMGQPCINAMHERGLGGGMVIPPLISPTRAILFPIVWRTVQWVSP